MPDLLYLAYNRLEFTRKSFETMVANTDWSHVARLVVYDDGSRDGTREYLEEAVKRLPRPAEKHFRSTHRIGPVGIMNDYIVNASPDGVFAKIDNDVMLPPRWLNECLQVMRDPTLDLLGIEAMKPVAPVSGNAPRGYSEDQFIGGIGLMRRRAFAHCLPAPRGRFGFTGWQQAHPGVKRGWIDPALPISLLNLMPFEPWQSLSRQYIANGWQRDWPPPMTEDRKALWEWWASSPQQAQPA